MTIDLSTDTHEGIYGPTTDLDNPSSSSPLWATHLNRVPFNHSRGRDIMMDSSCQGNYNPSFLTTTTPFHLLNDRRDNDHWSPYCGWFSCVCPCAFISIRNDKRNQRIFLVRLLGSTQQQFQVDHKWMWFDHRYTIFLVAGCALVISSIIIISSNLKRWISPNVKKAQKKKYDNIYYDDHRG